MWMRNKKKKPRICPRCKKPKKKMVKGTCDKCYNYLAGARKRSKRNPIF